jgi:hypothetical protein
MFLVNRIVTVVPVFVGSMRALAHSSSMSATPMPWLGSLRVVSLRPDPFVGNDNKDLFR